MSGTNSQDTQNAAVEMSVNLGGLKLKNPIGTASGTFGYGTEFAQIFDPSILGSVTLKALSMNPRVGNPPTRIYETPSGMLNSIGLQNVGVEKYFAEKEAPAKRLSEAGVAVIANLAAQTAGEFTELINRLEDSEAIGAYELNVSCPNVKKGGAQFGTDQCMLRDLVKTCRVLTKRPMIVKLAPLVTDIVAMATIAVEEGADGLALINTMPAMAVDAARRKPILATVTGGLSGPAIKPIALRMIHVVHQAMPDVPILGMGGIMNVVDVVEFLLVGASAVSVGTASFVDPTASATILRDLQNYCRQNNIANVSDLTGALEI